MKLLFKHLMCAALLIAMPLTFTSCNVKDNPLESSEVQGLIAALQEGAVVSYTIMENGVEKTITFKKEGGKFVLKSVSPATTRMHDVQENKRYILDWDSDDDGSGNSGGTNNGGSGGGGTFVFNVYAADGTPALTVVTRVADAFTQIATYNENYDLKGMTLNGQQQEQFNQALEKSKSGPKAELTCTNPVLSITISIPNLGVTTWKDINYEGIKLESDANNNLILTYKCKVDPNPDLQDVKFEVSYDNEGYRDLSTINDLVGVPSKKYYLEQTSINP